jgi:beta-galactosidase
LRYRSSPKVAGPAFWRAKVQIPEPGDTFLDLSSWSKGVVWVNGHCLGRFWNIGPTQTAYLPGPWLKAGSNEIVVLDLFAPENPSIAGVAKPVLDQLRPQLDFARSQRREVKLTLNQPLREGEFAVGTQMQEIRFTQPTLGRYFCLESINAFDGKPFAAVAELDLLDDKGQPLSHQGWTIAYVDSEERAAEDGTAENAIDGQTANFWHTEWNAQQPSHPHRLVLDLGQSQSVGGFRYVPRQGSGDVGGRIKGFRIYLGDGLVQP